MFEVGIKHIGRGMAILLLIIVIVFLSLSACNDFRGNQPEDPTQIFTPTPSDINDTKTITPTNVPTTLPEVIPTKPEPTLEATATPTLGIGSTSVSEKDGMAMVYVPAGEFEMGSNDDEINAFLAECQNLTLDCKLDWFLDEQPQHTVYLDAFWIDQTEVTNAMYEKCIEAGSCDQPYKRTYISDPNYANYPIGWITWDKAEAYCNWADRRLPTEAEWEKAAGWDETNQKKRFYPWGDEYGCQYAHVSGCVSEILSAVGSYESYKSPYGAYDMGGNASEWVADWYDSGYYAISPSSNPLGPGSGVGRVMRGGGGNIYEVRTTNREYFKQYGDIEAYHHNGFRCARDASP